MAKKIKLKIIIRVLLLILLAAGVGIFILFTVRGCKKVERFQDALNAFNAGDYPLAKQLLLKTLIEDNNNEFAYTKLAAIYHQEGNWPAEVQCWSRAMALDSTNKTYPPKLWNALLLDNDYRRIYSELGIQLRAHGELSENEWPVYVFAALRTNNPREAARGWKDGLAKYPALAQQPLGRLVTVMLDINDTKGPKLESELKNLAKSDDPIVAFDALRMLSVYYRLNRGTTQQLEDALKEAARINRFIGEPALAEYYTGQYRFDDAIRTYENYLKSFSIVRYALALADLYVYQGDKEKLIELSKKFHSGNKLVLMAGYYMDALLAFMDDDTDKLIAIWDNNEGISRSPLSALLALQVNIQRNNSDEIIRLAPVFIHRRAFLNFNRRALEMLYLYVQKLTAEGKLEDATRLARLLYDPTKPDLFLTRVILRDQLSRNTLDEKALTEALTKFPKDPFLLQLAAELYFSRNQSQKALEYVTRYRKAFKEDNPGMDLIEALALEQTGQIDAAFTVFDALIRKMPDNPELDNLFIEMCRKHNRKQNLETLYKVLSEQRKPEIREFLPYVSAEILLMEGKKDEALKLLAESDTSNRQLLFRAAYLLGENDRYKPAIRYYEKLESIAPDFRPLALINLSEIYKAEGKKKEALQSAANAWRLDPESSNVKFCYASRLQEDKEYEQVVEVLKLPRYPGKVEERLLKLWEPAMNHVIESSFSEKRYEKVLEYCRYLQIYLPESPVARQYIDKVNELQKK